MSKLDLVGWGLVIALNTAFFGAILVAYLSHGDIFASLATIGLYIISVKCILFDARKDIKQSNEKQKIKAGY